VISGGLTAPVDLRPGTVVEAEFDRIGSVQLRAA
jgi:2-keto-4-pentenoate hydratase